MRARSSSPGDVNLVDSEEQWWTHWQQRRAYQSALAWAPRARAAQQLGDYYVYPIKQLTTIANNQTKQVSFLDADGVKASKGYEITFYGFQSNAEPQSAEVRMRFSNSKAGGLGEQLPSGVVRVYMRDARGQPQFVGEDHIGHTSAGSEMALKIGDAFDVTVQPTLVQTRRITKRKTEYDMSYLVRNARDARASRASRCARTACGARTRCSRNRSRAGAPTPDSFAWDVPVPANGETTLTFTIAQRAGSMRATALIAVLAAGGAQARARTQVRSRCRRSPTRVSVTIYRDLFALITETRTVDLPAGPVTLVVRRRRRDAAARIGRGRRTRPRARGAQLRLRPALAQQPADEVHRQERDDHAHASGHGQGRADRAR